MTYKAGWTYTSTDWSQAEIEATASGGVVNIAVTDEHAMDSYNATFTCDIALPFDKVAELHAFLGAFLDVDRAA